MTSDEMNQ